MSRQKGIFLDFPFAVNVYQVTSFLLVRIGPLGIKESHLFEEYLTRHRHATESMEGSKLQNNHLAW